MSAYRKKPVVIEAIQISKRMDLTVPEWWASAVQSNAVIVHGMGKFTRDLPWVEIATLEGTMRGDDGDWIIQGVKGELYPCKPEIFSATYEDASRPAADESAKPVNSEAIALAAFGDKLRLSDTINTDWLTPTEAAPAASTASKEAKPSNNAALADLLIREICETDPADPNAEDTVCIGVDDLRLIIETCAIEAENIGVAGKEAVTLSDEEIVKYWLETPRGMALSKYHGVLVFARAILAHRVTGKAEPTS